MKEEILQLRIDDELLGNLKEWVAEDPELTASQFVRDAIREKLARDINGVVSFPSLSQSRKNIVPENGQSVAVAEIPGESLIERVRRIRREEGRAA